MRRRRKNACRQWQFFLTFLALWCRFTARTHREIRVSLLFPLSKETENESQKRTTITTTTKKGVAHTLSALFLQLATSLLVLHPGYQTSMCVVPNYGCWDTKEKKSYKNGWRMYGIKDAREQTRIKNRCWNTERERESRRWIRFKKKKPLPDLARAKGQQPYKQLQTFFFLTFISEHEQKKKQCYSFSTQFS